MVSLAENEVCGFLPHSNWLFLPKMFKMMPQGGHSTLKTLKSFEFDQNVKNKLENPEYEDKIEKLP